jgi:2-phosphoglycerate kinase
MMPNGNQKHNWNVLLIGGNSGAGKTTLARELSRHFDVPWLQVDDFRLAFQQLTTPEAYPALHAFLPSGGVSSLFDGNSAGTTDIWKSPPDQLCGDLKRVATIVSNALEAVIAHHHLSTQPVILEGDGILPGLGVLSRHTMPCGGTRFCADHHH